MQMDGKVQQVTRIGGEVRANKEDRVATLSPATPQGATNSPKKFGAISDQDSLCSCSAGFG